MKFVALISGGKDSIFSVMHAVAQGHEVVALANLHPPDTRDELDSYMFQTVGHTVIEAISQCMGLPLYRRAISGTSSNQDAVYQSTDARDEVEDVFALLSEVIQAHPDIKAVSSGAVLSNYQRVRIEHVCARLNLMSFAFLWRQDQASLLHDMLACDVDAVVVKVASIGLGRKDVGQHLGTLMPKLQVLHEKYGVHVAGEGGEYESLVLDCPLYKRRLVLDETEVKIHSDDGINEVAYMLIHRWHLEEKETGDPHPFMAYLKRTFAVDPTYKQAVRPFPCAMQCILTPPYLRIYNLTSKNTTDPEHAMRDILNDLQQMLTSYGMQMEHILFIHLLVSDMSTFGAINDIYKTALGCNHPPARVCVGITMHEPIVLHVMACAKPKHALHVQSLSYWAPANIGPYSQATRPRSDDGCSRIRLAGQIGMIPASLDVHSDIRMQARLGLRHVCSIANAFIDNTTRTSPHRLHMVSTSEPNACCQFYALDRVLETHLTATSALSPIIAAICYLTVPSSIDLAWSEWKHMFGDYLPCMLFVGVDELPKQAQVEWEITLWDPANLEALARKHAMKRQDSKISEDECDEEQSWHGEFAYMASQNHQRIIFTPKVDELVLHDDTMDLASLDMYKTIAQLAADKKSMALDTYCYYVADRIDAAALQAVLTTSNTAVAFIPVSFLYTADQVEFNIAILRK